MPNNNKITDYEVLNDEGTKISSIASSMQTILDEISNELKKLGSEETWAGTTASDAITVIDIQKKKFPEFITTVNDCSKWIKNTYTEYKAAESANAATGSTNNA